MNAVTWRERQPATQAERDAIREAFRALVRAREQKPPTRGWGWGGRHA